MLLEFILALSLGILAGTFTGLTPGIHINLISIFLLSISATLLTITSPIILTIFIVSMAITHTYIDYIPSIFLGAPNEDSFLSILPGHKLLLKGRGYYAIIFTLYGSLTAIPIIILLTPFFIYLLPIIYPYVLRIMHIILILVSIYLIASESNENSLKKYPKLWAMIIFLLSGFLGIASSNLNIQQPLLPLLTGLFGSSTLLISIQQDTKIPLQKITPLKKIRLKKSSIIKASFASIIAAPFTAFLPGLGAAQAALIGKEMTDIKDQREFLFLLGAINTIVMALSFIALYSIQKTRTGAAVAISELIPIINKSNLILILLTIILTGIISFFITMALAKLFAKNITKINYSKISITIILILFFMITIFSDPTPEGKFISILLFLTSTSLGYFTILIQIKRIHLMGCLLIPTILYFVI